MGAACVLSRPRIANWRPEAMPATITLTCASHARAHAGEEYEPDARILHSAKTLRGEKDSVEAEDEELAQVRTPTENGYCVLDGPPSPPVSAQLWRSALACAHSHSCVLFIGCMHSVAGFPHSAACLLPGSASIPLSLLRACAECG